MDQLTYNHYSFILQIIGTIIALVIALLAVLGEPIRNWLFGPKLYLQINSPKGEPNTWQPTNTRTMYYHLKVQNKGKTTARNVRVLLTGILKRQIDGTFKPEPLAAPAQFMWRWTQIYGIFRDIAPNDPDVVADIGFVNEGSNHFQFALTAQSSGFQGLISPTETKRLLVVVAADNFSSKKPYVVDIAWDGKWDADPDKMLEHLSVTEGHQS